MIQQVTTGHTFEEIVSITESRRSSQGPTLKMMMAVRDRYEATYVIPDPTGVTDDATPFLSPAILAAAVDAPALRAASVLPNVFAPALEPTKLGSGPKGTDYALARRGAVMASWHESALPLALRRSFRHIRAYNTGCWVVEPGIKSHEFVPLVKVRDPLGVYPEPKAPEDISLPANCAFVYGKSGTWLRDTYPRCRMELGGPVSADGKAATDDLWDVVEWLDEDHTVIGILGPRIPTVDQRNGTSPIQTTIELSRYENKAHCCPVVMPQTVSLSQVASQVAKIIGHTDLQAQIIALDIAATQRSIYPDRYIIGDGTKTPKLVSGPLWKEGLTGEVNIIADAKQIGELRGSPDPSAARIAETLGQHAERTTGLLPQMGGQLSGAARTGRGLDTLGAWAVDPAIQELQEIQQYALMAVNTAIIETYKGYETDRSFNVFFGVGGGGAFAKFKPSKELAESSHTSVSYAIAGADKQGTTVQLGQQLGTKLISHATARQKHPDIDDPELEERRILVEDMEEALKIQTLQRASTPDSPGSISPEDMAKLVQYVNEGQPLHQALLQVNKERAEIQATQPSPEMPPEMAQPGLAGPQEGSTGAAPPMPTELPGAGIQGPPADLDRFRMLAGALRQTSGR